MLLATFQLAPHGEFGGDHLTRELAERGVDARWATWDDPDVDWAGADLVVVRSTWDYHRRLEDFLDWSRQVADQTSMLNGPDVFAWNAVKTYLRELGRHVAVVPTLTLDDANLVAGLSEAVERWGSVVVKPATGAGGVGLVIVDEPFDPRLEGLTAGPWVAQPLLTSIRTHGETSVFVLGGRAVAQVEKLPVAGEVRVHEQYGGSAREVAVEPELGETALSAVRAAERIVDRPLDYARVDLLVHEGRRVVSEIELIEPGLYLEVGQQVVAPFADLVASRLAPGG